LTQGKPADLGSASCLPPPPANFGRGRIFVTGDGSAMTFISDTLIDDRAVYSEFIYPTGYLFLRDGTRFRIENGIVLSITDRNGNQLLFEYDQYKNVTAITDSLNRRVNITYGNGPAGATYDEISWKGFQGVTRTIRVWGGWLRDRLRGGTAEGSTAYSLRTMHSLFPEMPGQDDQTNSDWPVISAVQLPDGRRYEFYYNSYVELARVELPTGGAYEYDLTPTSGVITSAGPLTCSLTYSQSFPIYRRTIERRVYPDGLTLENKTTYTASEINPTPDPLYTVVDVRHLNLAGTLFANEKHYFQNWTTESFSQEAVTYAGYLDGKEYLSEAYDINGTLLRKSEQTFAQRAPVPWWGAWQGPRGPDEPPNDTRLTDATTTLADVTPNLVTLQTFAYDQYNNRTDSWEYDFAPDAPPSHPVRHTRTTYLVVNPVNATDYTVFDINSPTDSIHLRSLPKDQFVYAINQSTGADIQPAASQTTFEYDKYDSSTNHAALVPRSDISGHDSSFSTSRTTRGNSTEVSRWLDTTSTWITINQQYDIAGNIVRKIDARGYATIIDFSDRFGAPNGEARANTSPTELSQVSQTSYGFPTSVTNPLQHTAYSQYDYYIGRVVDGEDERGVIDSGFYNDILDRATQLVEATNTNDKRQTAYTYDDPGRTVTTTTDQVTYNDNQLKAQTIYDGVGRQTQNRHYETPTTYLATQQTYDAMGRVHQVSNPYRMGDTILSTTTDYDALGRKTTITTPDQAAATISYSGNSSTFTDQASKKRTTTKDALGRLTAAIEDPGSTPHLNYQTTYAYNVLEKLTHITQGSQSRDYSFDSLGRLKQATIPEQIGSTFYGYDNNSNLTTKTDPRGVVSTYVYDSLNRIGSVSYDTTSAPSVALTPSVAYSYDAPSVLYSKGELTGVTVSSASFNSSYTYDEYDSRGRVKRSTQTTDGHTYALSYGYDVAGHLTSETYPSLRVITISYDGAGRVSAVNGSGRATPYAEQFSYTPHGEVKDMKLGNGLWEHTISNNRLQLTEIGLGTTQGGIDRLKLNYDYGSTNNNGNLLSQTNTVPGSPALNIVQTYGYTDGLNRLTSVQETASQTLRWTQSYVYDRYGNRTSLTNTGSEAALLPTQSTPAVTAATNRFTSFTYDNAGNVKIDAAGNSFVYDAENRQTGAGTSGYSYDGDGLRVRKIVNGVTTIFVYDSLQHLVAEYPSNNPQPEGGGGTSFLTSDHLGSTRVVTDASGNVKSRHDYMPFGEEIGSGIGSRTSAMKYGAADGLRQKFTSKQRDTESGLDYFGARYYSSPHARFSGVDPLMESAHSAMPQTWNRFAYVLNNPLVIIDPNGEGWVELDGKLGWDDRVFGPADVSKYYPKRARFLPEGTLRIITGASQDSPYRGLVGWVVSLGTAGIVYPSTKAPEQEVKQIEWYGGDGEKFLAAYFRFAVENALFSLGGEILGQVIDRLYQAARATRASESTLKVIQEACFVAGTRVTTSEGDRPIEELRVGDVLITADTGCDEQREQQVTRVFARIAPMVLDISVGEVVVSATPEHPFWVDGKGWTAAAELRPGNALLTKDKRVVRVNSIQARSGKFSVYNLEVGQVHTYYVSELGILVHNTCRKPPKFPFLKSHAARHSGLDPNAYFNQAVAHTESGSAFNVFYEGERRIAYVTRTGPDSFLFTSTSRNGRTIFTHYEVNGRYLSNKGITLPKGF